MLCEVTNKRRNIAVSEAKRGKLTHKEKGGEEKWQNHLRN